MPRGIYIGKHGPAAIPDAQRICEQCATPIFRTRLPGGELMSRSVFLKRKFCGKACAGKAFDARPVKSDPCWATAHHHARKAKPKGPCERCGKPGRDVHHKDDDWRNNAGTNLERLCRPCHTKHHKHEGMCGV